MTGPIKPLPPEQLFTACDAAAFAFDTTAELEPLEGVIGQDRAVQALTFAIGMRHEGYNLFALGPEGTGKASMVISALERHAAEQPVPGDWCYVNNFAEPHRPGALGLPPGKGRPLRADMERLIEELRSAIPAAFESDEYRNRKSVIEERVKEHHEEVFTRLQERAKGRDIAVIRTPVGLALAPVREGAVLKPDEFEALPADDQAARRKGLEVMQKELEDTLKEIPKWEKELREKIRALNREVTLYAVSFLIDEVKKRWAEQKPVLEHLDAVHEDVVENAEEFLGQDQQPGADAEAQVSGAPGRGLRGPSPFRRYQVNVVVDNGRRAGTAEPQDDAPEAPLGAPVVEEEHPTQPNLIGRIDQMSQFGTLVTDFNLIKAGALHRANGGYLILDARKLVMQPLAWETLKRALQMRRIRIESLAESMGWAAAATLEPEPIPLEVKVVLLGEPTLYYLLNHFDPDFRELFKVAADFDNRMDRNEETATLYAQLIGTLARREGLRPLHAGGVARVIEHGARLADDAEKLSAHIGSVVDVVREADYWAGEAGSDNVLVEHVQKAIDAKIYRSDRLRERIQEEIRRGTLVIETEGARTGQINGLSVILLDHFSFGRPSRISCRVRMGRGEVIDIERAVALGGPLHSKGVMILSSYLSTRFARNHPLTLSASLVFEQSYGGIDGDSASSAELYAILSAISAIPIKQSFAVTGSVDQNGNVQAIGGVNEKIEGFFDVCAARGLTGDHGVLIPAANVKHLMLRCDVVEAAAEGRFHVFAVETVDQGIELLTGVPAGAVDESGDYPIGTVNRAVANGLVAFARKAQDFATRQASHIGGPSEGRGK